MSSKPLQYESSKAVMLYLDPNLRIKISQHAPSLRSIERLVPLRVHELSIGNMFNYLKLNNTEYRFRYEIITHRRGLVTLNVKSSDGENQIHKTKCTYEEGMKKLATIFLGNRQSAIHIKLLTIMCGYPAWTNYMPIGLRLHTRNLRFHSIETQDLDVISSIMAPESFPLDTVQSFQCGFAMQFCYHKMVREAKNVYVLLASPSAEFYLNLIAQWLEHGKPVGTMCEFGMEDYRVREILEEIKTRPEVIESLKSSVTLSMPSGSKLIVSFNIHPRRWHAGLNFRVI